MKKLRACGLILVAMLMMQSCATIAEGAPAPTNTTNTTPTVAPMRAEDVNWPKDKLETGNEGVPHLSVYVVADKKVEDVDIETYVQGVLAGEMKNDWPLEALKAQAILARTFVLKFVEEKTSQYEGADISTDIEEAQAYDASAINDRIKQAVSDTRGLVLTSGGDLPYAWFHAHSGGVTEFAKAGLGWNQGEPGYTQSVASNEPETVNNEKDSTTLSQAQTWKASFSASEFAAACKKQGVETKEGSSTNLSIEQHGESGRALTIGVDGKEVSAAELRIALGSTKMRSTLLTSLRTENGKIVMEGKGYGHGVGMSQWGAYGMAEEGKTAEEIVKHYFKDVSVVKIW